MHASIGTGHLPAILALALFIGGPIGCGKSVDGAAGDSQASTSQAASASSSSDSSAAMRQPSEPVDPVVLVRTNLGDLTFRLNLKKAPQTVYNFMSYCGKGHYDGTIFHQVEDGYAILGGGYTADLNERVGRYPIP